MKEDPRPLPTKPSNKLTSTSTQINNDDDDIYSDDSPDNDFDLLASEDEHPTPEHLPDLDGWVDAGPLAPPEYTEGPASTLTPSWTVTVPPPMPNTSLMPTAAPSPFQVEQHPLLVNSPQNHASGPSNRNTSVPSQSPPIPSSRPSICVVCQRQPVYTDDGNIYTTCSMRCEQSIRMSNNTIMRGEMENPRSSSRIRMCEVCRVRPKCQRGGKIYPTCGLTCAAKLNPPGSVEMCDFCKKRPKAVVDGRTFPQCGKTCRDNAKMTIAAAANSATCTTCILCWKASSVEPSDFCSPVCEVAADTRAPFLIELPRGHRAFRKVADKYIDDWKQTRNAIPRIKRVYMVQIKGSTVDNFEQYRNRVNSHAMLRKKGNEQNTWLGVVRECGLGDPGNVKPCSSATCQLCCVVRSHGAHELLTNGIPTASLPRAVDTAKNTKRRSSRVVLMAKVLYGKVAEWSDSSPPKLPPGHDSVHLTAYTKQGNRLDFAERLVYNKDAIRPMYLITIE